MADNNVGPVTPMMLSSRREHEGVEFKRDEEFKHPDHPRKDESGDWDRHRRRD